MASLSLPTSTKPLSSTKNPKIPQTPTKLSKTQISKSLKDLKTSQTLSQYYLQKISSLCKDGHLYDAFNILNQMDSKDLTVGPEIYSELLQGCVYERALSQGQQIHARIIKNGAYFYKNEYIETKILIFYAKCDCLSISEELFLGLRRPNVFSWAAMIGLYSRLGINEKALVCFCKMVEIMDFPDNFVIPNALRACSALQWIGFGRGIHGYVLKMGFGSCVYVLSSLVDFYGKCGVLDDAKKIFDRIPERSAITWNSLLVGFVQNGLDEEALEMFYDMRINDVEPTRVSIANFLSASANLEALDEGRQAHGISLLYGLELDNILGTSLINFYCKLSMIEESEMIFDHMMNRDVVTWNLLISGYILDGHNDKALYTCRQMRKENLKFDSVTLSLILSACADAGIFELGRISHAYCIRNNLDSDLAVSSSIIDFYASCGKLKYAQRAFDVAISKDLVLWNSLIFAYAQHGLSGEAFKFFYQMQLEGAPPNLISWNSVILGFVKNGQINEAEDMLSEMQLNGLSSNFVTWVVFIFGLVQKGCGYEAINFFVQMQWAGVRLNSISIIGVLFACSNIMSLRYGRVIHGHIMRRCLFSSISILSSLIDMYAKCGSINLAIKLFDFVSSKDISLFNSLICGLSFHGKAKEALELYKSMHKQGIHPVDATFTVLLSACSSAGLIIEGLNIFMDMVCKYNIIPRKEDYRYFVKLLLSCGTPNETLKVLSSMLLHADSDISGSLLDACKDNQDIELAQYLLSCLLESEPAQSVNYTSILTEYKALGKWRRDSILRELVKETGLWNPRCTWIQIGSEIHAFEISDKSHPQIDTLSETLLCLHRQMTFAGCTPTAIDFGFMEVRLETLCS